MVPEGTVLVSRSGTVGNVLLASKNLSRCAITEHAIRLTPDSLPAGFLYVALFSSYGQALLSRGNFGATVEEIEPKHIGAIEVPLPDDATIRKIAATVHEAFRYRDQVTDLLVKAEASLYAKLGIDGFTEEDIEYLGDESQPRAFETHASELDDRMDATNHVPLVRSAVRKLHRARVGLSPLRSMCQVFIPARFKREYVSAAHGVPYVVPSQLPTMRPYEMKALSRRQAQANAEFLLTEGQLLVSTDGTVGRVHPVTQRMVGWFGSNNLARISSTDLDLGFLYAFLATDYGLHQICKPIYGGVVDHITEGHIEEVLVPELSDGDQQEIGQVVRDAFKLKDLAVLKEDEALADFLGALSS